MPSSQSLTSRYPLLTIVSIVCLVPLALLMLKGLPAIYDWFLPQRLAAFWQQPWTLWTPSFVHYTPMHLVTNLCFWWYLGLQIERHSRLRLALLVVVTAAISNGCQWLLAGPDFGGLSGVVYSLLGYVWIWQRSSPLSVYRVDPIIAVGLLAMIPLTATGAFGKYANIAHLSGMFTGALIAVVEVRLSRQTADSKEGTHSP